MLSVSIPYLKALHFDDTDSINDRSYKWEGLKKRTVFGMDESW